MLKVFCYCTAIATLGSVSIVPFDLVGDERRSTAAAPSWQGATFFDHLRNALLRFCERQPHLLKHLRCILFQSVGLSIMAFLTQRGCHPGENTKHTSGAVTADEQLQGLPGLLQCGFYIVGGKVRAGRLERQIGSADRHTTLLSLFR